MRTILVAAGRLLAGLAMLAAAGCAGGHPGGPPPAGEAEIAALTRAIGTLGPGVDPAEAARAARVALTETHRLARAYRITDPPLIHNTKVNLGLKPRGLCWHWAEDLQARLAREDFASLTLHRAIANADNPLRIDHSTVIVAARGDGWREGLVLDPWRQGGVLFWTPVPADPDYDWQAQERVLAARRAQRAARPGWAVDG